jgi:hypothetical protein
VSDDFKRSNQRLRESLDRMGDLLNFIRDQQKEKPDVKARRVTSWRGERFTRARFRSFRKDLLSKWHPDKRSTVGQKAAYPTLADFGGEAAFINGLNLDSYTANVVDTIEYSMWYYRDRKPHNGRTKVPDGETDTLWFVPWFQYDLGMFFTRFGGDLPKTESYLRSAAALDELNQIAQRRNAFNMEDPEYPEYYRPGGKHDRAILNGERTRGHHLTQIEKIKALRVSHAEHVFDIMSNDVVEALSFIEKNFVEQP